MKKIIGILLVGFLGLLGCSDGDDGTATVGKANPVAPFGIIETSTPTYEWTPVRWATRYRLTVQDANEATTIQDAQETSIIDEWYTVEEAGCASEEEGLCMVTPDIEVFEEYTWKVQACANENCGEWSEPLHCNVTAMNEPRFTDNEDGTVTDNKTKLMWTKDAEPGGRSHRWQDAYVYCEEYTIAGHSDWRLPTLGEFLSLIDLSRYNPALPLGHPFTNVQDRDNVYWTQTLDERDPGCLREWVVFLWSGEEGSVCLSSDNFVWPVSSAN